MQASVQNSPIQLEDGLIVRVVDKTQSQKFLQSLYHFTDPHLQLELKVLNQQELLSRQQHLKQLWNVLMEQSLKIPLSLAVYDQDKIVAYSAVIDMKESGNRLGQEQKVCWPNVTRICHELSSNYEESVKIYFATAKVALIHAIYTNEQYRGRGLQKKMAAITEDLARKQGFDSIHLLANNGITDHIFVNRLDYDRIASYDTHQYQRQDGNRVFESTSELNRNLTLLLKRL